MILSAYYFPLTNQPKSEELSDEPFELVMEDWEIAVSLDVNASCNGLIPRLEYPSGKSCKWND